MSHGRARDFLGLGIGTIRKVARASGLGESYLSRVHNGLRGKSMTARAAGQLAPVIGMSVEELLSRLAARHTGNGNGTGNGTGNTPDATPPREQVS